MTKYKIKRPTIAEMAQKVDWWGDYDIENMTVADAIELNKKAKLTCEWETTTETEEN